MPSATQSVTLQRRPGMPIAGPTSHIFLARGGSPFGIHLGTRQRRRIKDENLAAEAAKLPQFSRPELHLSGKEKLHFSLPARPSASLARRDFDGKTKGNICCSPLAAPEALRSALKVCRARRQIGHLSGH